MNINYLSVTLSGFAAADLQKIVDDFCIAVVIAASIVLVAIVFLSVLLIKKTPQFKTLLFTLIAVVTLGTTFTISSSTVYLNAVSATGGPVHWSADVEFWACGNQLEIRNPSGLLTNKIGTSTMYEQNDGKIHYTGTPINLPQDASLAKFMQSIGGNISDSSFTLPLNDDNYFENSTDGDGQAAPQPGLIANYISTNKDGTYATFNSGQNCDKQPSEVQIYVFRLNQNSNTYTQAKVSSPQNYAIAPYGQSPPGDCIIVEFGLKQDKTDKLCQGYGVRDQSRCGQFGVRASKRETCDIREVF